MKQKIRKKSKKGMQKKIYTKMKWKCMEKEKKELE